MSAYIIENIFGIFALDENENIIDQYLFGKDVEKITTKIHSIQKGDIIEEYEILFNKLAGQELILEHQSLGNKLKEVFQVKIESPHKIGLKVRKNFDEFLKKINKTFEEYEEISKQVNTKITRRKVKETAEGQSGKDKLVIQAIESLDDLDKSINLYIERIREWYGLHFPELDKKIPNHQVYLKFVQFLRNEMTLKELQKNLAMKKEKLEDIASMAKNSMGSNLTNEDFIPLKTFGRIIQDLSEFRNDLSVYIDRIISEIAPNMRALISPNIIARLISHVGGLLELASKPSSTIQILGAEKALFRSLKTGANPPKHGVIFQDDKINSTKWWLRGKIARLVAAKLTIAARIDAFGGDYRGDKLIEDLEVQIRKLEEKHKEPPKKKKAEPKKSSKKKRRRKKRRDKKKEGK